MTQMWTGSQGEWTGTGSFIMTSCPFMHHISCRVFGETSNHPGDSAHLQPRLGTLDIWLFPKPKSPLKGKRFQTLSEVQENTTGQLMAIRRAVWGPKVSTLKGTETSLSYVPCFLYLLSSSINVPIFHITWLDIFWTGLVCVEWQWEWEIWF